MSKSSFIPNSTQTPNDYFDKVMPYLSGNEWKVLSFAIRHILGFHDRIANRTHKISLSMFADGYGAYAGTGLSRPAIITTLKALTQFNLLVPVGDVTPDGQEWYLHETPDLEGLVNRFLAQKSANKKRARKALGMEAPTEEDANLTDEKADKVVKPIYQQAVKPVYQDQSSDFTDTGKRALHKHRIPSNLLSKRESHPSEKPDPTAPTVGNIIQAWVTGIKATSSAKSWGEYNRMIAQDMLDAGITPADVTAFLSSPFWSGKTPSLQKVAEQIGGWKAQQTPSASIPVDQPKRNIQHDYMAFVLEQEQKMRKGGAS